MTFGEKLQLLRKSKGLSQEQLASQIATSRQAISKWELGESMPDIDNLLHLSKFFNVSTDYLLNDDIESETHIPTMRKNFANLKKTCQEKTLLVTGIVLSSIGALGNLVLWTLSTMIKVHIMKKGVLQDGTIVYYGGGDVLGYDFGTFISEYRLSIIFYILLVSTIAGITLLLIRFIKQREKKVNFLRPHGRGIKFGKIVKFIPQKNSNRREPDELHF
jgi:transcriptional regulator with XRE-family HTH domain